MKLPFQARLLSAVVCGAALLALSGTARAVPVSAWELGDVSGSSSESWSFGELFTVGASNVVVTGLGALDVDKDGFVTNGGIAVGLYRESDQALLASTHVRSSDALVGNYRFSDIADVLLSANTAYRVVAVSGDDLYNVSDSTPIGVDPRISWNSYAYCRTTALTFCDNFPGQERTWLGNFQLDAPAGSVPEPSSLALLAVGLLGVAARRRRQQQG